MENGEKSSKSNEIYQQEIKISIKQTKLEKWILNINLVIIVLVAIGLYVFFSIPPQYHIFQHLNVTKS